MDYLNNIIYVFVCCAVSCVWTIAFVSNHERWQLRRIKWYFQLSEITDFRGSPIVSFQKIIVWPELIIPHIWQRPAELYHPNTGSHTASYHVQLIHYPDLSDDRPEPLTANSRFYFRRRIHCVE